jgi:2-keto-4-pentenoate hydratase/2-oxohepta-3-ene-1,7-dioic acid hydratase in catechol pathway
MRYIGFLKHGKRHIGREDAGKVYQIGTVEEFFAAADQGRIVSDGELLDSSTLEFAPPVPPTSRIFCVGMNYHDHAAEARDAGFAEPKAPMIFGRWASTLVVDGTPVPIPPNEKGLDWEVELAVVIGKTTWHATEERAMDAVAGYTVFNDLSARAKQMETIQFTLGKNADRSGPIGHSIVTPDELGDVNNLRVTAKVNGSVMQDANTKDFIHSIPRIISYITDTVTLLPGDVIATGTPGGVGVARKPPILLQPGDVVEVAVDGIGAIRNPIISRNDMAPTSRNRRSWRLNCSRLGRQRIPENASAVHRATACWTSASSCGTGARSTPGRTTLCRKESSVACTTW